MKQKIEDLKIGQTVEVHFFAKIVKLERGCAGTGFISLKNPDGDAFITEGHLEENPSPEEVNKE